MAKGKKTGRGRRKKVPVVQNDASEDNSYACRARRSSMRVNLSFTSNLSDSGNSSLKKTNDNDEMAFRESAVQKDDLPESTEKTKNPDLNNETATPASTANITVINNGNSISSNTKTLEEDIQSNSLLVIKEKEQRLNKSCMQLKNAIMNKTQALFDKENELAIKTTEVLARGYSLCSDKTNETNNIDDMNDKRSPSVRVNIGKNDQIIMSGDGKKSNPVQVNSMGSDSPEGENVPSAKMNDDSMDCNQSIASTPKKSKTESSTSQKDFSDQSPETILRIPVARLFADDNDPNNSMSELNPLHFVNNPRISDHETSKNSASNISRLSNELYQSTSPILSQGIRRSRLSRLSLKKKLTTSVSQTSRDSSSTTNESFINKIPITCSSFIENQNKINIETKIGENSETIEVDDKSKSTNDKTIDLGNSDSNKTINLENSSKQSSMEITTIPCHMPIVRRSFQELIRRSLKLDNVTIQNKSTSTQRNRSTINKSKDSNEKINNLESDEGAHSDNIYQKGCSINTVRTSLNVNMSFDHIDSSDKSVQKENEIPNKSKDTSNKSFKQVEEEGDTIINQRQSTCTIRTSMQVNTSLDSMRKSSVPNFNEQEKSKNKKILRPNSFNQGKKNSDTISKQSSNEANLEKGSSDGITSRPSTSTVRSSMQVNTSLDSVQKSPITKNLLDFNKILSMVEETSTNSNLSKASVYTSKDQTLDGDSELENISLMERIRNISATKKSNKLKIKNKLSSSKKTSTETENSNKSSIRKSIETKNTNSDTSTKSTEVECSNSSMKRKSIANTDSNTKNNSNRVKNISSNKKKKSDEIESFSSNTTNKSTRAESIISHRRKQSVVIESANSSTTRKSERVENTSSTTNESSIIEATPYPTSRSVLLKTMIKNNIAMNTLDPRKFIDLSDNEDSNDEIQTVISKPTSSPNKYRSVYARKQISSPNSMDTVILNSSDELSSDSDKEKEPVIIDESLNETKANNESISNKKTDEDENKRPTKRKLYLLRDNSQLISFSPSEIHEPLEETEPKTTRKRKPRKLTQKKKQETKEVTKSPEPVDESDLTENEVLPKKVEKVNKRPRKIISKKIVVKKVTNIAILDEYMNNEEEPTPRLSERNSLREFDLRRMKNRRKKRKNHRIIIVVTGLGKEEKDLVKSVIKALGSATLEANVTPRTTHVVSSGVRTINLLKGIIRGCWLLTMEWALKSLESEKWLDPSPYEMSHFSKAVQENRRDRQLFGKAYVPELFVTCGFIYVENGTSPPSSTLKELIKISGGRITEDPDKAQIVIGAEGLKEIWILDSITTGEVQILDQYKRS